MSFIAIDLKVVEGLAAATARASGTNEDRILAGLVRTWHRCWADGLDVMTRVALGGVFGGDRLDELIEALTAFGFLEPRGDGSWRIKGADKYLRVKEAIADGRRRGGLASAGNLRRGKSPGSSPGSSPADSRLTPGSSPASSPNTEHRTPIEATTSVNEKPLTGPVERVFEAWRLTTRKPRAILDDKRRRLIKARLSEGHSEEDLLAAIAGYARSPHHQGQNERQTKYLALDLWFRDASHVEAGMAMAPGAPSTVPATPENTAIPDGWQ